MNHNIQNKISCTHSYFGGDDEGDYAAMEAEHDAQLNEESQYVPEDDELDDSNIPSYFDPKPGCVSEAAAASAQRMQERIAEHDAQLSEESQYVPEDNELDDNNISSYFNPKPGCVSEADALSAQRMQERIAAHENEEINSPEYQEWKTSQYEPEKFGCSSNFISRTIRNPSEELPFNASGFNVKNEPKSTLDPVSQFKLVDPEIQARVKGSLLKTEAKAEEAPKEVRDLNAYAVMTGLIQTAHVVQADGMLYFYERGAYLPQRPFKAKQRIMEYCRGAIETTGTTKIIKQVYDLLLIEPRICREADLTFNAISFDDGVLLLDKDRFVPHDPNLFVTTRLNASYHHGLNAECPVFEAFLRTITEEDPVLERRIWQALAYLLVPDQTGKVFIVLQGVPNSGKSVLGDFVRSCFIGDVVSALEINDLSGNFTQADLIAKKICLDLDLPADLLSKKSVSKLKKMTGGDKVSTDVKFQDRARFTCTAKFLFGTNHPILLGSTDQAFQNRLVVIPFTKSIPKEQQDFYLKDKLEQERSAIVVRALSYYSDLVQHKYVFAGNYSVNESTGGGESVFDRVMNFIKDDCTMEPGRWTSTDVLYDAFTVKNNEACSLKEFSKVFFELCTTLNLSVKKCRSRLNPKSNPISGYQGITLRHEEK